MGQTRNDILCPFCKASKNSSILYQEREDLEDGGVIRLSLKCNGCSKFYIAIEQYLNETDGRYGWVETIPRPKIIECKLVEPKDYSAFPPVVDEKRQYIFQIYREVTEAINHGLLALGASGIRMLIDTIAIYVMQQDVSIQGNLNNLGNSDKVTPEEFSMLQKIQDIGHGAIHRQSSRLSIEDLCVCTKVIENIMERFFIYSAVNQQIQAVQVPPRA